MEFSDTDTSNSSADLKKLLQNSNTWLAFNVSEDNISSFAALGIGAGVQRAIFNLELPPQRVYDTSFPDLKAAADAFRVAGRSFTGIRHGRVVPGSEDCDYEIVNATTPCAQDTIPRGVLFRVVSEMLRINSTHHKVCGVSASGGYSGAYLSVLRSKGLSRQAEVEKVFGGGIQRVTDLANEEERQALEKNQIEEEASLLPTNSVSRL